MPVGPDFDPGGEETGLEESPAAGGDEDSGAVELEAEVDPVPTAEVTGAATEAPIEAQAPVAAPEPPTSPLPPEPESAQRTAMQPAISEPVANQSIVAPPRRSSKRHAAAEPIMPSVASPPSEAAAASESAEDAPSAPPTHPATTPADVPRQIGNGDSYIVRPGDCLWQIAAALLPAGAADAEIAEEVARLWKLNEDRIGTGDPSVIYAGTELRLR